MLENCRTKKNVFKTFKHWRYRKTLRKGSEITFSELKLNVRKHICVSWEGRCIASQKRKPIICSSYALDSAAVMNI